MKANQAFRNADEAVSPVIGVILMVAITVVLAAVVFVLVTRLAGGQKDQSPTISFSKVDEPGIDDGGSITVVAVNGGAVPRASVDIIFDPSGAGTTGDCTWDAAAVSTNVEAGDAINCVSDGTLRVTHTGTNTLLYQTTFGL